MAHRGKKPVDGLRQASPIRPPVLDTGAAPKAPTPYNPIKGLQDALKAAQVMQLAKEVAAVGGKS